MADIKKCRQNRIKDKDNTKKNSLDLQNKEKY